MNLESLTLAVRPRTPWEAMDLSARLAVTHWRVLLSSWMVTVLPVFLIINIILLEEHPYWAFILIWFLKPLYDRVPLFVLSRVIFAEKITWKDTINAIPSFFKTGVFSSLTLYRLDPGRAFGLPVRQLEGLQGKRRRQRMNTLGRGVNNREVLFFVLCFHLESLVTWGALGLLIMMLPAHMAMQGAETIFMNTEPGLLLNSMSMILYFLVMMIVETLYVAGGFVLYLNRRIILEGWDIELTFRKLKQRNVTRQMSSTAAVAFTFVFLLFSGTYSSNTWATEYDNILPPVANAALNPEASKQIINEVMESPVFNRLKKIEALEYTGPEKNNNNDKQRAQFWLTDIFEGIGHTIAFIFEIGLWFLLIVAIFLLVKYRDRLKLGFARKPEKTMIEMPEMLFGLDLTEDSLPEDVTSEALAFFQKQDYRAALALLYRATLAYLVRHYDLNLEKGATEGDCLTLVTRQLSLPSESEVSYFVELTRAWQITAYAHRDIPAEQMKQLCLNWSRYYE